MSHSVAAARSLPVSASASLAFAAEKPMACHHKRRQCFSNPWPAATECYECACMSQCKDMHTIAGSSTSPRHAIRSKEPLSSSNAHAGWLLLTLSMRETPSSSPASMCAAVANLQLLHIGRERRRYRAGRARACARRCQHALGAIALDRRPDHIKTPSPQL